MSDEIDDFIRRAAERRKKGQGQGQRKPQRPPAAQPAPAPTPRPRARLAPEIVEAEVVEDINTSVARHLNTQSFQQRATQMTEVVDNADERVEARLQQTFDHKLGRLGQSDSPQVEATSTARSATDTAAQVSTARDNALLLELLRSFQSPQSIRQAVILSDILARPEHRW